MIPDDPKFWWEQDTKFYGQVEATTMQYGLRVFAFRRTEYFPVNWFIVDNTLRRFPYVPGGYVGDWKLTNKQVEAFYRDWEKFHNG